MDNVAPILSSSWTAGRKKKPTSFELSFHFSRALKEFAKEETKKAGYHVSQSVIVEDSLLQAHSRLAELDKQYQQESET